MKESRTKNSILNFASSMGSQSLATLLQFIVRTVFIRTLGEAYLGLGGLFSNILTMLSLAELGVGNAIIFRLYEPIAKGDHRRITILLRFYRKVYFAIGLVVAIIGIALIPVLPHLIKDYDNLRQLHINAVLVYCIFLFQSVASYWFFAYKQAIVNASQKAYSITVIGYFFAIGVSVLQIICLYVYPSFTLYILISVVAGIVQNLVIARFADKKYPYIRDQLSEKLSREDAKEIFKDCSALMIYKINNVVVKSTDNIVLSKFLGLGAVALYSNYYIFYKTITSLYTKVYGSVGHGLGDLHTTGDREREYQVFRTMLLLSAVLGGTAMVGIFVVADEFVATWIGGSWQIAQPFALLMGIELFTAAFKSVLSRYRTVMGLFQQAKFRPVAGMLINLALSIWLVRPLGIVGVLIGTVVSDWTTILWYDPLVIHRLGFENHFSLRKYYARFLLYFFLCAAVGAADLLICRHFCAGHGWLSVAVHAAVCGVTTPAALLLVSLKTPEGEYCLGVCRKLLGSAKKLRRS